MQAGPSFWHRVYLVAGLLEPGRSWDQDLQRMDMLL